ncbi:flagellin [Limnohabitans sp.]|uniref:flagellin N-terminal helical domain-containing protein n=1 Tax=Limnohabitans sp. TaxID=1907725 RepID=UPI002AFE4ECE|nr:flagellin [Limnohabitans sp.]
MTVVNSNISAVVAQRAMAMNQRDLTTAMTRLSTGKRVNGSSDDAAGIAIGNKMGARISSLNMAVRNANEGISMLQTADGAAGTLSDMLFRMKELAIQSSNDTNSSSDRSALQTEITALQGQITNILDNTEWNGMKALKGEAGDSGTVSFHVGASSADSFTLDMTSIDTGSLADAQTLASINLGTRSGATNALSTIEDALTEIDQARSLWGATANRLVYAADNATNVSMNTSASRSRIMDADYAQTTADLARAMILDQAGAAMLTQANQRPMYVLALLR